MAKPKGFIPDAPVVPAGFVPDQAPQPASPLQAEPSWFQRYVAGPATRATAGTLAGLGETALLPLDLVASLGQRAGLVPDTSPFGLNVRGGGLPAAEQAAQAPARFLVPQSGIEAGALLATGGAGPLASAAGKAVPVLARAPGWLSRIAASTLGGELGGQATGEPTGKGAAIGGAGALLGEGAATLGGKVLRSVPGAKARIAAQDAKRIGEALGDLSAPLKGAKTADDIRKLVAGGGQKKLSEAMDTVVEAIERSTQPIAVPSLDAAPLTLSAVQAKLTDLRRKAFPKGTPPSEQQLQLQDVFLRAKEEILTALDTADPTGGARALYDRMNAEYAKGKALLGLFELEPVYRAGAKGVELATPYLQGKLAAPKVEATLRRRLRPSEFDQLVDAVTRGGRLGTKDEPAFGKGRMTDAARMLVEMKGGTGALVGAIPKTLLPNLGARYTGRLPYTATELQRTVMDLLAQKGIGPLADDVMQGGR